MEFHGRLPPSLSPARSASINKPHYFFPLSWTDVTPTLWCLSLSVRPKYSWVALNSYESLVIHCSLLACACTAFLLSVCCGTTLYVFEFVCRNQQQSQLFVLMFLIPHLAITKHFLHLLICQTKLNHRLYLRMSIASVMSPVGQVLAWSQSLSFSFTSVSFEKSLPLQGLVNHKMHMLH